VTRKDPTLLEDLRSCSTATLGDPMRPLLWVSKSHAKLARRCATWHRVSASRILNCSNARYRVSQSQEQGADPSRSRAQFDINGAAREPLERRRRRDHEPIACRVSLAPIARPATNALTQIGGVVIDADADTPRSRDIVDSIGMALPSSLSRSHAH